MNMQHIMFDIKIRIAEIKERAYIWLAWKLPKALVKWASVRLMSQATVGEYSGTVVPDLTATDALRRWGA